MKTKSCAIRLAVIVTAVIFNLGYLHAQDTIYRVAPIPFPLDAVNLPLKVEVNDDSVVVLTARGKTNLFNSPGGNYYQQDAGMLLFHPDSDFTFSAKVQANLSEVYDVAALVLYQDKQLWAKLCFENSADKEATVVSVVTRQFSDDCNSIHPTDNFIYLAIAKKGDEISFHCSSDNQNWYLVRHFRINFNQQELRLGFAAHCSRGESFTARFSDIQYSTAVPENMRKYNGINKTK